MTLQLDPGCGDSAYTSTIFEVTVNGQATHCYGSERTAEFTVDGFWEEDDLIHVSCARFGTDAAVTVRVRYTAAFEADQGAGIQSVVIFPRELFDGTYTVTDGVVEFVMPVRTKVRIEADGFRAKRVVYVGADLLTTVPAGPTVDTYNGTQLSAVAGRTLVFPAGVFDLFNGGAWNDKLFPVEEGASVYFSRGSWVIGNLDYGPTGTAVSNDTLTYGPGNLSGEYIDNEDLTGLPFLERLEYAMFHGILGLSADNSIVRDLTVWRAPFYTFGDSLNGVYDLVNLSPWTDNVNGFDLRGSASDENRYYVKYCAIWVGDDVIEMEQYRGAARIGDTDGTGGANLFSTMGSDIFMLTYTLGFPVYVPSQYESIIGKNYAAITTLYEVFEDGREYGGVFKCWTDAKDPSFAISNVTADGVVVEVPDDADLEVPIFNLGNKRYPWGDTLGQRGRMHNFVFRNITATKMPTVKSRLYGYDWQATPHDVHFVNVRFGSELLTTPRWFEFFQRDANGAPYPFHIFVGEQAVVLDTDIVNTALSYVGERDRVTSIDPPDGSEEARHAARAYVEAFEELIELHTWSFALRKIQLTAINTEAEDTDDPAWPYRYEIPEGMHEALAVLPDEASEDYVIGGVAVPEQFHIKFSTEDEVQRIYSKIPDAWLRYTVYISDPNQCSRLFNTAFTWLLASKLAGTVARGDQGETMKNRCLAMFSKYLAEAKVKDHRQRQVDAQTVPVWMQGRGRVTAQHPFRLN